MGEYADREIARQMAEQARAVERKHAQARNRKVKPRDPTISAATLAALRAATLGHDHVDLGTRRLPGPVYEETTSVLRQLGARWHGGRKLFTFAPEWSAERFAEVLRTGQRPRAQGA